MKRVFILGSIMTMMLLLFGCNDTPSTENGNYTIEALRQEVKDSLVAQDSLLKDLVLKVDTLTQELNKAKDEISQLQSAENKKPSMLWDILPLIFGFVSLIAVFVVGWFTRHDIERKDVKNIINKQYKNIVKNECKKYLQGHNSYKKSDSDCSSCSDKVTKIEEKNKDLERRLSDLEKKTPEHGPDDHTNGGEPRIPTKCLYAKSKDGSFFTEIIETKQETCAFVIELESETKGKFDIVSFSQIKQMNGLDKFIHLTGRYRIEDATDYKTICKGECEKQGGLWKVVKELEISLF